MAPTLAHLAVDETATPLRWRASVHASQELWATSWPAAAELSKPVGVIRRSSG